MNQFLKDFRELIQTVAQEMAVSNAEQLPDIITARLMATFGGEVVYIGKEDIATRNRAIYAEFTGDNCKHLSHKYGITEPAIYRIIKKERDSRAKPL